MGICRTGLESVGAVALDSARARVELDTRTELVSAELAGAGQFDGETGERAADLELGLSVEEDEPSANGSMALALRDVPVSDALAEAALGAARRADPARCARRHDRPCGWTRRRSRSASIPAPTASPPTCAARARWARAMTSKPRRSCALVRTAVDEWSTGGLEIDVGALSLPDALDRAEELLAADWQLPDAASGLAPLMLDEAALAVAFDSRTPTFLTDITGTGHLGEGPERMDGSVDLSLVDSNGERFARGGVTLGVQDLALTGVLDEVASLLPGEWGLPDDLAAFDALQLDEGELAVGFDTRTDSLSARARGSGSLESGASGTTATSDITFLRLGETTGAAGTVEIGRESVTMAEALDQIAEMLPGSWALPDGLDAFETVALDRADFLLGFDTEATASTRRPRARVATTASMPTRASTSCASPRRTA
ncbi:MAG: hypothetical protein U5R14_14935 [Gemmatimonadota bacterium]|nr:hypothetical protein [Gemmatimonadota bacterium]